MLYRSLNPWRELNRIQNEMNRMFDNSWHTSKEYPAINLWTNADGALLTAELPGYNKESVDITLTGDILRIHGSRKAPECKEDECFHRQERNYGVFDREIQLPFKIDPSKVEANFNNGVLSIQLQHADEDKPKTIEIKTK